MKNGLLDRRCCMIEEKEREKCSPDQLFGLSVDVASRMSEMPGARWAGRPSVGLFIRIELSMGSWPIFPSHLLHLFSSSSLRLAQIDR